jgi:hypothetical protein
VNLEALINALKPICKFDKEKTERYRNSVLLREILHEAVPSLITPVSPEGQAYGS